MTNNNITTIIISLITFGISFIIGGLIVNFINKEKRNDKYT